MSKEQHGGWFQYRLPDGRVVDVGVCAPRYESMRGIADKLAADHGDAVFINAYTYCCTAHGGVATSSHGARVYTAEEWARMEENAVRMRNADPLGRGSDTIPAVIKERC